MLNSGKIVPLFDTYSAVWSDCTLMSMLNHYMLNDFIDTFCLDSDRYIVDSMGVDNWVISWSGIRITFPAFDLRFSLGRCDPSDPALATTLDEDLNPFLYVKLTKIRLELSGKGLQYLSSHGVNTFYILRQPLPDYAHATRIDIAFDLVDYKPDFLITLRDFALNPTNRVGCNLPIANLKKGFSFSVRTGDQETIYIGAPTSEKLLRIYDKKLQYSPRGVLEDTRYGSDIQSWIRIEWQLRNKKCQEVLFGNAEKDYFLEVFKLIYSTYLFRDVTMKGQVVCKWWQDLFDWSVIPAIMLDTHLVQVIDVKHQIEESVIRTQRAVIRFAMVNSFLDYLLKLRAYLTELNFPDSPQEFARRRNLIWTLNAVYHGNLDELRESGKLQGDKFALPELDGCIEFLRKLKKGE